MLTPTLLDLAILGAIAAIRTVISFSITWKLGQQVATEPEPARVFEAIGFCPPERFRSMDALVALQGDFVLDREVAALDPQGKASFQLLENSVSDSSVFYVFEAIH